MFRTVLAAALMIGALSPAAQAGTFYTKQDYRSAQGVTCSTIIDGFRSGNVIEYNSSTACNRPIRSMLHNPSVRDAVARDTWDPSVNLRVYDPDYDTAQCLFCGSVGPVRLRWENAVIGRDYIASAFVQLMVGDHTQKNDNQSPTEDKWLSGPPPGGVSCLPGDSGIDCVVGVATGQR